MAMLVVAAVGALLLAVPLLDRGAGDSPRTRALHRLLGALAIAAVLLLGVLP
jgi:quinol-cytochrome oxidoreductase complex cytochrome b subunit